MKSELLFSHLATAGVITATIGITTDVFAVPLFAVSAAVLVLLVVARDYSPRKSYDMARRFARPRELRPLAA